MFTQNLIKLIGKNNMINVIEISKLPTYKYNLLNKNNEIVEIAHLTDYEAKTKNLAYKFNKTNLRFEKSVCSNSTEVDTVKLILPNSEM